MLIHYVETIAADTIIMNESMMKLLRIPKAQHISLQFGVHTQTVKLLPTPKKQGLFIHPKSAQKLGIPMLSQQKLQLHAHYDSHSAILKLGPLISVLISKEEPENQSRPFGVISTFCRELAEACMRHGALVYFFTPNSIPNSGTWMNGWILDGEWKKQALPMAEVVYNRLPTRKLEQQPNVQRFFQSTAKEQQISIFNERFLDKHDVFQALQDDDKVKTYLPESHLLQNASVLSYMLDKYRVLYVKPVQGSQGKGIYRITALDSQRLITLEAANVINQQPLKYANVSSLFRALKPKLLKTQYQLQQGLSVIQIGRKPVDFRALVQKNTKGQWSITSIVARTAGDEKFVANLATGGTIDTVVNTLPRTNLLQHVSSDEMLIGLRRAAIAISEAIDRNIDAHFGELGVDLAIDVQGRIWLLEVNSKPSKKDNTPLQGTRIRPSVRMVISYAKYLTGFKEGRSPNAKHKSRYSNRKN